MAGMIGRAVPDTKVAWKRIAPKVYQHKASNIVVKWKCNDWVWEIVGGPVDGRRYGTLNVAQHFAVKDI